MKILLGLSLLLNFVLVGWVVTRPDNIEAKSEESEDHPFPRAVAEEMDDSPVEVQKPRKAPVSEAEAKVNSSPMMDADGYELSISAEKVEQEKADYLVNTLLVPEELLRKHEVLREKFNHELSKSWGREQFKEPSIEQKRRLLDIEEEYLKASEKLFGKENWEKYQKYREEYNKRGFERQLEEKAPFIFMSL